MPDSAAGTSAAGPLLVPTRRHLAASSLWAVGGFGTLAVASVAVNATLTRTLTPDTVGVYFLATSIVLFAATAGRAGLNLAVVRLLAGADDDTVRLELRTVLRVAVVAAALVGLLLAVIGVRVLASYVFDSPRLGQLTVLLGCWAFVEALRLVASEALRGLGRIGAATLLGDAGRQVLFLAFVATTALVASDDLTLDHVVGAAIGAGAAVTVVALLVLRRTSSRTPGTDATPPTASRTLRLSLPMMVTGLSLLAVTQGDVWLAGVLLDDSEVGIYAATARLVLLVVFPLHIGNVVLTPLVARLYAHGRVTELERVTRLGATAAALPTVVIVGSLFLFAEPILGLVYGEPYRGGATVLRILACGQLVNALLGACGQVLLMTGHQKSMMTVTLVGGALFFAVGAVVTRSFGMEGLAVTSALTTAGTNVALWLLVLRKLGFRTHATLDLRHTRPGSPGRGRHLR